MEPAAAEKKAVKTQEFTLRGILAGLEVQTLPSFQIDESSGATSVNLDKVLHNLDNLIAKKEEVEEEDGVRASQEKELKELDGMLQDLDKLLQKASKKFTQRKKGTEHDKHVRDTLREIEKLLGPITPPESPVPVPVLPGEATSDRPEAPRVSHDKKKRALTKRILGYSPRKTVKTLRISSKSRTLLRKLMLEDPSHLNAKLGEATPVRQNTEISLAQVPTFKSLNELMATPLEQLLEGPTPLETFRMVFEKQPSLRDTLRLMKDDPLAPKTPAASGVHVKRAKTPKFQPLFAGLSSGTDSDKEETDEAAKTKACACVIL